MPLRLSLFLIFILGCWYRANGQIVDDTTKQIYGPKSSRYRIQEDLFWNKDTLYRIDTSINDLYLNDDYTRRTGIVYKDLGNLGTSMEPLFFALPTQIGRRLGFNAFNVMAYNPERVKFYNTYSPYSSLKYLQGGNGRQEIEFEVSQNVTSQLNFALTYRRLTSWKQIGTPTAEEKESDHNSMTLSANYFSKNSRYQMMVSYTQMNHRQAETGGIQPTLPDSVDGNLNKNNLFNFEQEPGQVSVTTSSRDIRQVMNLYHQFQVAKNGGFILFHEVKYALQKNYYYEDDTSLSAGLYRDFFTSSSRNANRGKVLFVEHKFSEFENKFGIKTKLSWAQLAIWAKRRDFSYWATNDSYSGYTSENYVGGAIRFDPLKNVSLDGLGEYIVGRDYQLKAKLTTGLLYAKFQFMSYSPTVNQLQFTTPILNWNNGFKQVNAQSLEFGLNSVWGRQILSASVEFTRVGNYVYYGNEAKPVQLENGLANTIVKFQPIFRMGKFVFNNDLRFANSSNDAAIRMPKLFAWLRWYYDAAFFNKAAYVNIGFDFRIQSGYYGNRYMPITQQFITQSTGDKGFYLDSYPVLSPYISARIQRASVFLEGTNVLEGLAGKGYFISPYYPGTMRLFGFGVRWFFFD